MRAHVDIETFSEIDLRKTGVYPYAGHPSTEVLCIAVQLDGDDKIPCWNPDDGPFDQWFQSIYDFHPSEVDTWVAHNAEFERTLLNSHPGRTAGFPATRSDQWVCTAAKAAASGLPRALGNAAKALGLTLKDEAGKKVMLQLCKPRTGAVKRYSREEFPEKYSVLYDYCINDVRVEAEIDHALPDLSPFEQRVYALDQEINRRGVKLDRYFVETTLDLIEQHKRVLAERTTRLTNGIMPSQTGQLAAFVRDRIGYPIPSLQSADIRAALLDPELPALARQVLMLRANYSMASVAKYDSMLTAASDDDRLRGMYLYHGAGTGRWSSLRVQLHNLARGRLKDPDEAIRLVLLGDLELLEWLYGLDPMVIFSSCVRGALIADDGNVLVCRDFSAIESRVNSWLSGQDDILHAYRTHGKVYELEAGRIYQKDYTEIENGSQERLVGKVANLALGFQGGANALLKMGRNYGLELDTEQADDIKTAWRKANHAIVRFWYALEQAAIAAVKNPGHSFGAGVDNKILFKVKGDWLGMRLPSERVLRYFKPELMEDTEYGGSKLTYLGTDTYTRQWGRVTTYGGRLCENAVQATARDLLADAMVRLDALDVPLPLVGTVHDEIIAEVEESRGDETLELMGEVMKAPPDWAIDLPLGSAGFVAKRYRKD